MQSQTEAPRPAADGADEPIAALVTPPGVGGVAVVRASGRGILERVRPLFANGRALTRRGRSLRYAVLREPSSGRRIDEAVVLGFVAPRSYTGEDVVEFQVHGGRIPARRVLDALASLGVRTALPGEFTRRAFLNGRIDLSQAEAVMDLIGAQSDRAAQAALGQLEGRLRHVVERLYDDSTALCADVEATLDFAEEDVPDVLDPSDLERRSQALLDALERLLASWREGRLLRHGALVVISGPPNAGKSALFNALLGHARAIVTPRAGTTRDSLEETLLLDGIPVRLTDTAGLRESCCDIEREGVRRTSDLLSRADAHLRVHDLGSPDLAPELLRLHELPHARTLVVLNKADRYPATRVAPPDGYEAVMVSAATGQGLEALRQALRAILGVTGGDAAEDMTVNARHRELLEQSAAAVGEVRARLRSEGVREPVLLAQALRSAAEALGFIIGRQVGADVLDQVFSRFCVGK